MEARDPQIVESFDDIEIYKKDFFINKIGIAAMEEEKKKNKQLGIPSSFIHNGKIYYELADGSITDQQPWSGLQGVLSGSHPDI